MFETIDETNFVLFAAKNYDNPNCTGQDEFEEDLKRIKYIKKLFKKYSDSGDLKERLVLNHVIVLYNVFEPQACTRMLCYKLRDYLTLLKPFLVYLNFWPERIGPIGKTKQVIVGSDITMDQKIINTLRAI